MPNVKKIPREIRDTAAAWLARIRSDNKTAADIRVFREWLAQDPIHVAAFEAMTDIWETLGSTRRHPVPGRALSAFPTRRHLIVAGTTSLAVVAAVLTFRGRASATTYETGVGEQHHVVLADGTQAFLDTSTRIRARFDGSTRVVELDCGRCNFDVKEEERSPFVVNAANERIVAGHTTLDVRRDAEDVTVILIRGSAAVSGGRLAAEKPCVLRTGERLIVRHSGVRIDTPDLSRVLAWQTGQVVFENVTLTEAVQELNRYSIVKMQADSTAAQLRISGVFQVGDNVAFARLLIALLPVSAHVESNHIQLIKSPIPAKKG